MVKISEYKGYEINYDSDKLFWCNIGNITQIQFASEKEVIACIEDELERVRRMQRETQEKDALKEVPDFKISIAEPRYLKDSVKIIKSLACEARFIVDKDKVSLVVMDPANVAMVIWELLNSCCMEYDVPKRFGIALNMTDLNQVLEQAKSNDIIVLEKEDKDNLKITLKGDYRRSYTLPFIELDSVRNVPELKFTAEVVMPSRLFEQQVKESDLVGESVTLVAGGNKISMICEGESLNYSCETFSDNDITARISKETKAKFSIEYLKKMVKGRAISDKVKIQFSTDYPVRLDYVLLDKVSLSFILAPRVDND